MRMLQNIGLVAAMGIGSIAGANSAKADDGAATLNAPVSAAQSLMGIRKEMRAIDETLKGVGALDQDRKADILIDLGLRAAASAGNLAKLEISGSQLVVRALKNVRDQVKISLDKLNDRIKMATEQPVPAVGATSAPTAPVASAPAAPEPAAQPVAPMSQKERAEKLKNDRMELDNETRAANANIELERKQLRLDAERAKLAGVAPAAASPGYAAPAPLAGPITVPPGLTKEIIQYRTNYIQQMFGGMPITEAQQQLIYADITKDQFLHGAHEMAYRMRAGGYGAAPVTVRAATPTAALFPTPEREQSYRHREDRHGLTMKYGEAGLFRAWNENAYRVPNTLRNWGFKIPRFIGTSK